jgi:catechol 2,3-dioxygenase-like lactoylglutathione lyase family enzyme
MPERLKPWVRRRDVLAAKEVMATVAVRDLGKAKKFYEGTLGLKLTDAQEEEALTSQSAGSNKATATTWLIGNDIEKVVQSLKGKGVSFEHYDMPGMSLKGDIHVADGMSAAWFKDPDGNIHALVSG